MTTIAYLDSLARLRCILCGLLLFAATDILAADYPRPAPPTVPGVVISHSPASSGLYIGSPSIARLPDGALVATHDLFGPASTEHQSGVTAVYRSEDGGRQWRRLAWIDGAFWSNLFVHRDSLYLMGTTRHHGAIVIRRSDDGGSSWTVPEDADHGLLTGAGEYHTAPVPVAVHAGRIWRGFEEAGGGSEWGARYRAMMLSAPLGADLLRRDSWTMSEPLGRDSLWLDGRVLAWLEGNAVVTPDGRMVDVMRLQYGNEGGKAALIDVSEDGKTMSFDAASGFIDLPGGEKKFSIRYDPVSAVYWALVNPVTPASRSQKRNAASIRNTLALASSRDLRRWELRCVFLHHPDAARHGFQYADWQFDGEDLVAVVRTAYDDGLGGAGNAHDANHLTFHRMSGFRALGSGDPAAPCSGEDRRLNE